MRKCNFIPRKFMIDSKTMDDARLWTGWIYAVLVFHRHLIFRLAKKCPQMSPIIYDFNGARNIKLERFSEREKRREKEGESAREFERFQRKWTNNANWVLALITFYITHSEWLPYILSLGEKKLEVKLIQTAPIRSMSQQFMSVS